MSETITITQIKRWVSTLMWLRHNGRRWKTYDGGGQYTVAFDKKEEKEWISCLPAEYQDIVKSTADKETERLKSLRKRTGKNYSELLIHNSPVI